MATQNVATAIPSRRAALAAGLRGAAALFAVAPAAALGAVAPAVALVATPSAGGFDLAGMLARWNAASAKTAAALDGAWAIDVPRPPTPLALRARADDRHEIRNLRRVVEDRDNANYYFGLEYGPEAAAQINHWKEARLMYWRERAPGDGPLPPWVIKARERAEEILAAFNAFEAERDRLRCASGIDEAEAAMNAAMHAQGDIREEVARAPASAESIALKLRIFADYWKEDHDGDETAGVADFDDPESPAVEQAVAIALDLLTLARRAGAGDALPVDPVVKLGTVASSIVRGLRVRANAETFS
jgi:hypothetical protein